MTGHCSGLIVDQESSRLSGWQWYRVRQEEGAKNAVNYHNASIVGGARVLIDCGCVGFPPSKRRMVLVSVRERKGDLVGQEACCWLVWLDQYLSTLVLARWRGFQIFQRVRDQQWCFVG